jgi:hypothetical protein
VGLSIVSRCPLLAESSRSNLPKSDYLSVRFSQERTFGGELAGLSYCRRIRVGSVGTVQILPPLPNEEWGPLWDPFSFGNEQVLNLVSREAAQVPVEAGMAGRHN